MKVITENDDKLTMTFEGHDEINFIYHLLNNDEDLTFNDYKKNNHIHVVDIGWDIWKKLDDAIYSSDLEIDW